MTIFIIQIYNVISRLRSKSDVVFEKSARECEINLRKCRRMYSPNEDENAGMQFLF